MYMFHEGRITLFLYNKIKSLANFHLPSSQLDHTSNGQCNWVWCHSEAACRMNPLLQSGEMCGILLGRCTSLCPSLGCLSQWWCLWTMNSLTPCWNHPDSQSIVDHASFLAKDRKDISVPLLWLHSGVSWRDMHLVV